ncbi:MAG TPA: divalent-cation tolerance protein CutA [Hyphomicrobiaceae bacterium]|nr:divalent-cation tolerance protein CutA [Hyphomicrobiaceae bacterium]
MPADAPEDRAVLMYVTCPTAGEAERIGGGLVDRRLAACVNILPEMTAIFQWQGERQTEREAVMIVKTRAALADAVTAAIRATHPYTNPAIVVLEIAGGSPEFLAWILAETRSPASG